MKSAHHAETDSVQRGSSTIAAFFAAIIALLAATFGLQHTPIATTSQPAAAAQSTTQQFQDLSSPASPSPASSNPASSTNSTTAGTPQPPPNNVESAAVVAAAPPPHAAPQPLATENLSGTSSAGELAQLQILGNQLQSDIAALPADNPPSTSYLTVPAWAASQRINQLSGVTISNSTIDAASIPDLSGDYLSLNGGTVNGTTTITKLSVASTNTGVAPFFVDGELPQQVGALPGGYYSTSVIAVGTYLYGMQILSDTGSITTFGFSVYDISNPLSPVLVSSTIFSAQANSMTGTMRISGHYIFMITNQGNSPAQFNVLVVDVSSPVNPTFIQATGACNSSCDTSFGEGFDVAGRYLYDGSFGSFGLYTYDESDPHNPVLISRAPSSVISYSVSTRVRGDYLYNLDSSNVSATFSVVNIKNPSAPTLMGSIPLSEGVKDDATGQNRVALSGNYAYVQDDDNNLLTINISAPSAPVVVATSTLPGGSNTNSSGATGPGNFSDVFVAGRYLYASAGSGLAEYNISAPGSPQYVGVVPGISGDITISGRYMYTANGNVYDLGGAYIQRVVSGDLTTDTFQANQSANIFGNLNAFGGLTIGAAGLLSYGPAAFSGTGGANVLEVTAATTSNSTGQTASFDAARIRNFATSSTASVIKTGLNIQSAGSWTGAGASNIGLYVSSVTGGTNNFDAIFNGGGDVGIGTASPYSRLQVTGPDTASTSAFAVVNSASTTVFAAYDNGNATYAGSIFQSSDQRLKTDITSLDASSSLSAIESLNPVSYLRLDQPGTGENLGFIAQQVQQIFPQLVSTSTPTALTPNGTLTLNYEGLISPIVSAIQDIASISGNFETNLIAWLGNTSNGIDDLFAQNIYATKLTAADITSQQDNTQELCVGDGANDPSPVCITKSQLAAILTAAGTPNSPESVTSSPGSGSPISVTSGVTGESAATDTPPVIQINGNNPATVSAGAAYTDLGATITGPQADLNLGINVIVDGEATTTPGQIEIDTAQPGTHTIEYVATDQNGLEGTATRTVIVSAPAQSDVAASSTTQ